MTRATVGGINSEDNLWYPLAVNSQGIAQIDTSGIPQPMEWEERTFTPYYAGDDEAFSAVINYDQQHGVAYKLGDFVTYKIIISTSQVAITNPRGNLIIAGLPFIWLFGRDEVNLSGSAIIANCNRFRDSEIVSYGNTIQTGLAVRLYRTNVDNNHEQLPVTALAEHTYKRSNYLQVTGSGIINGFQPANTSLSYPFTDTPENPTGTP